MKVQRLKVPVQIKKYENGLNKIQETNEMVAELKIKLQDLIPKIKEQENAANEMMKVLKVESASAKEKEEEVTKQEEEATVEFDAVKKFEKECQGDLDKAIPAYEKAKKALNCVKKSQIDELRTIAKPSEVAVTVFNCVLTLLGKPTKWDEAKKQMQNSQGFLDSLLGFDKDSIPQIRLKNLKPMLEEENMKDAKIEKASAMLVHVGAWIKGI